jgi:hypothetical protein
MMSEALATLCLTGRETHPDDLPLVIEAAAGYLGAGETVVYLADLGQRELVPLYCRSRPPGPPLSVEGTLAGRAYQTETIMVATVGGGTQLWVPVQDSAERVGVLAMTFAEIDAGVERAALAFASLVGEYVVTKARYGDALERTRRRRPLTLAAEMRWELLPPLTYRSPTLTISGALEPAYEVAGDTFDYAVVGDEAHLAVFDAVGHGLEASRIASVAVSTYRNARRRGASMEEIYRDLDETIIDQFGRASFTTASLARVDTRQGTIRMLNAGHPLPLLLRDGTVVRELECPPSVPAGLGGPVQAISEHRLQPEDTVVFYTDGVVEARSDAGEPFGLERLVDHIAKAASGHHPTPEGLRRLMASILEHQHGRLQDDASALVATWHGPPSQ